MVVDNISLCVAITILMVICGLACLHVSMRCHKDSVVAEVNNMMRLVMLLQSKSRSYELMAIMLLVACWMPCSNAAWLTDAKYRKLQRQIAAMPNETNETHETHVAGATREISERSSDDRAGVDYEIDLGNGAKVSWASSRGNNERTRNTNRASGTTLALRWDRGSIGDSDDTDPITDNAGSDPVGRTADMHREHTTIGDEGSEDF